MSDSVNLQVTNFKKALEDKKDFPQYVTDQFNIVLQKEESYNKISLPFIKNKEEKRKLEEEEEKAVSLAYETISIVYSSYKVKKLDKDKDFIFGSETPATLKHNNPNMLNIIDLMLNDYLEKNDKIIKNNSEDLTEAKKLLEKVIANGNVIAQRRLLISQKKLARKSFELEFRRLKHLVIAALLGTGISYKIFFPSVAKPRKKTAPKKENSTAIVPAN